MSQPTFNKGVKRTQLTEIIEKQLGTTGRMIAMSKSRYKEAHPKSIVYFNACIFDELLTEVWWGDVDLIEDKDKLEKIAEVAEQTFYLTTENPYRADFHKVTYEDLEKDEHVIKFNTETCSKCKKVVNRFHVMNGKPICTKCYFGGKK